MSGLPDTIWTIGHSTRTLPEFLGLLHEYRIEAIADVRRFPGSRSQPQFGEAALAAALLADGIAYEWIPKLGGRRKVQPGSPNTAWRNASFQGYADYIASAEFAEGLAQLLKLAATRRTAIMCAEVLWWRCHRSLIADVLKLRGIRVLHLIDATHTTLHPYTSAAQIVDGRLSYAPLQTGLA